MGGGAYPPRVGGYEKNGFFCALFFLPCEKMKSSPEFFRDPVRRYFLLAESAAHQKSIIPARPCEPVAKCPN